MLLKPEVYGFVCFTVLTSKSVIIKTEMINGVEIIMANNRIVKKFSDLSENWWKYKGKVNKLDFKIEQLEFT